MSKRKDPRRNFSKYRYTVSERFLLALFRSAPGSLFTREAIIQWLYVGEDEKPDRRVVDVFVCKLRKKMEMRTVTETIESVRGEGYVLRIHQPAAILALAA